MLNIPKELMNKSLAITLTDGFVMKGVLDKIYENTIRLIFTHRSVDYRKQDIVGLIVQDLNIIEVYQLMHQTDEFEFGVDDDWYGKEWFDVKGLNAGYLNLEYTIRSKAGTELNAFTSSNGEIKVDDTEAKLAELLESNDLLSAKQEDLFARLCSVETTNANLEDNLRDLANRLFALEALVRP